MLYDGFFHCLSKQERGSRVPVGQLSQIVNNYHTGVGTVTFKYFPDFPGAEFGTFIWLDEDRSSAHEEPFNDAVVFINDRYRDDRPMRRLIAAKELMHVFDTGAQKTDDPDKYRRLLKEIQDTPVQQDMSDQYAADRIALWKATIALIPPWIRAEFKAGWDSNDIKAPEIAARLWLPEATVSAAMGDYYDQMLARFVPDA